MVLCDMQSRYMSAIINHANYRSSGYDDEILIKILQLE